MISLISILLTSSPCDHVCGYSCVCTTYANGTCFTHGEKVAGCSPRPQQLYYPPEYQICNEDKYSWNNIIVEESVVYVNPVCGSLVGGELSFLPTVMRTGGNLTIHGQGSTLTGTCPLIKFSGNGYIAVDNIHVQCTNSGTHALEILDGEMNITLEHVSTNVDTLVYSENFSPIIEFNESTAETNLLRANLISGTIGATCTRPMHILVSSILSADVSYTVTAPCKVFDTSRTATQKTQPVTGFQGNHRQTPLTFAGLQILGVSLLFYAVSYYLRPQDIDENEATEARTKKKLL